MDDRVAKDPGRVLITPEDGIPAFYATMTRADNPVVEGTKINKNALLKDATAALFGLGTDAVPDDVLALIKSVIDENYNELSAAIAAAPKMVVGSYTGTEKYGEDNPTKLTFSGSPKLVIIGAVDYASYGIPTAVFANPQTTYNYAAVPYTSSGDAGGNVFLLHYKVSGNTLYWYSTRGANVQNNKAIKYYYMALLT